MSNAITVHLAPLGDHGMPTCRISHGDKDIPVIAWKGDGAFASVEIHLGNHNNPGQYLMDLAELLAEFAIEVDGTAKPVPFRLADAAAATS